MHFFDKGKTLHGALLEVDEQYHVVNNLPDRPVALPVMPSFCVQDCAETLDKAATAGGKTAMYVDKLPDYFFSSPFAALTSDT